MSGSRRQPEQTVLFDLELDEEPAVAAAASEPDLAPVATTAAERAEEPVHTASELAPLRARLVAGGIDLGCHVAVAATGAVGAVMLGVAPERQALPGLALLVIVFSLFFLVVPLAFWGKTAGMAAAGIACRAGDDQPLTFGEAGRRWLGTVLTVLCLGLPALLVLAGGRSLADRLSGSDTVLG